MPGTGETLTPQSSQGHGPHQDRLGQLTFLSSLEAGESQEQITPPLGTRQPRSGSPLAVGRPLPRPHSEAQHTDWGTAGGPSLPLPPLTEARRGSSTASGSSLNFGSLSCGTQAPPLDARPEPSSGFRPSGRQPPGRQRVGEKHGK